MAIVFQGQNPASKSATLTDILSPLAKSFKSGIDANREKQENLQQGTWLAELHDKIAQEIQQRKTNGQEPVGFEDIMRFAGEAQGRGLSPQNRKGAEEAYGKYLPQREELQQKKDQFQQTQKNQPTDKAAQTWAYGQLNKEKMLNKADEAIERIGKLSGENVTGPFQRWGDFLAGVSPRIARDKAIRDDIDALSLSVIGTHSDLFKSGSFTDREFNFIKDKVLSSKMTPESLKRVGQTYQEMNNLARRYVDATKQAVNQYGFIPELPFVVQGMVGDYEKEAARLKDQLLSETENAGGAKASQAPSRGMGEGGQTPGAPEGWRSQNEKAFSTRHKATGEVLHGIPLEYLEEARQDPDYEVIESEMDRSPKVGAFGETESEREERLAEKRRLLRKKK